MNTLLLVYLATMAMITGAYMWQHVDFESQSIWKNMLDFVIMFFVFNVMVYFFFIFSQIWAWFMLS